mgnify:CR=1 FL=1
MKYQVEDKCRACNEAGCDCVALINEMISDICCKLASDKAYEPSEDQVRRMMWLVGPDDPQ